ncbi:HTH domain-containing protein, partial [Paenibacillus harenae]
MSKRKCFTPMQIKILESNPNVVHVSEKAITYSPEFKRYAVKAYMSGITPMQIFTDGGFETTIVGTRNPRASLERW